MAGEQLPLLERMEVDADGVATALRLPDDLPELWAWIGDAISTAEGPAGPPAPHRSLEMLGIGDWVPGSRPMPDYSVWPHGWVLRDLVAALPDALNLVCFAGLVEARRSGRPVDAREVQALIAAVVEASDA